MMSGTVRGSQGYKMCLNVSANGDDDSKGTHVSSVSVFIHLMHGEFDDNLKWPFWGKITLQLLNQIEDTGHRTEILDFND